MPSIPPLVAAVLLCAPAAALAQQADSAGFIIRLGNDTTAVERYVRRPGQLVAEAVQRSPSTMLHRMTVDLDARGGVSRTVHTIHRPGSTEAVFARTVTFGRDSTTVETVQGGSTRTARVAAMNAIPISGPFYSPYELAMMRAAAGRASRVTVPLLQGTATVDIPVERIGRDTISLTNQFGEPMRAHVDARGRLLHLGTPAFTTVERVPWVDLEAMARDFAARDEAGRGMGPLSPRQAFRATVGQANVWVDYGRPAMRGRPVWGALVPYGSVWRMGANDAAHLATDRPLQIGGLRLEPGTYTLFLLPTADEWTLVVNRRTSISGLEYEAAQDVGRVPLALRTLERPVERFTLEVQGGEDAGELVIAWDRTRASVPIRVP